MKAAEQMEMVYKEPLPAQGPIYDNQILTVENVAKHLKVSTKTVYKMVEYGTIPYKDLSPSGPCNKKRKKKCIRFLHSELVSWMKGKDYG